MDDKFKIPVVLAVVALSAVLWLRTGGLYSTSPDPVNGARTMSGPFSNGVDSFQAFNNEDDILIRRLYKKGVIRIKEACEGRVSALASSPAARLMAAAGSGRQILLWELSPLRRGKRPKPAGSLTGEVASVRAMAFSGDGARLLVLGDKAAELWDVASRTSLAREDGPWPETVSFLVRAGESSIRVSGANLEYVKNEDAVERGGMENPPVLIDSVSGLPANTFGKPYAESWSPEGRYRGYGDGEGVVIWRLCRSSTCRAVAENGKTVMR